MQKSVNKSKTLTAIIVFIAAVIGSFAISTISNLLFDTFTTYIMSAYWSIVILAEVFITRPVVKTKSESLILGGAFIIRLIYMLYRNWGFAINGINMWSDAIRFWNTAADYYSGDFRTVYNLFPYFVCGEFYIWGKNLFCCLLFNVFASYLSCVVFLAILNKFELKNMTRLVSLSIVSFLPYSIYQSAQLMREPLYYFFINCSFYFFADYIITSKTRSLYSSLLSLLPPLLFHIGFFPIVLIYMAAAVIKSYKSGRLKKPAVAIHCLLFAVLIGMMINFESMDYLIGNNVDHFDYFFDKLSGNIHHKSLLIANSAYLLDIRMDSVPKFLIFSPVKLLYFLFSPLPPYWHSLYDIVAFVFDSSVHMLLIGCVIFCCVKCRNELSASNGSSVICYGILSFVAVCFVFALGTSNAGTAIRHRDVFIGMETVIFALCFDKIKFVDLSKIELNKRNCALIMTAIMIVQVHFILYTGARKQEFHIDEIYSYTLSNSYDSDKITNDDSMWNTWISGDDLHQYLTVQKNERFAYSKVYRNNTTDCHPPLYYWILHTVCSFSPDNFSKWSGLSINVVLFVSTALLIYLISDEIIGAKKSKFLPVILWGFSGFAVDTCIFIRMYMLLTAITACFIYLHVRMFRHGVTMRRMILVFVTVFLGAMTHYYSLVAVFWGALFFAVYLLRRREIKKMLIYGTGVCLSVGLMFLCYPYAFEQATGSSTNNVGNQVMQDLFNFSLWGKQTKELAEQFVSGISYTPELSWAILSIVLLFMLVSLILKIRHRSEKAPLSKFKEVLWMTVIFLLTFLSVTFIGGVNVAMRYIYFIIPISCIVITVVIGKIIKSFGERRVYSTAAFAAAVVFAFANAAYGTATDSSTYLYRETAYLVSRIGTYSELPLLVLTERDTAAVATGNLRAFELFDKVYMTSKDDLEEEFIKKDSVIENCSCVVYITVDEDCAKGYGYDLDSTLKEVMANSGTEYKLISKGRFGGFYYVHKK